MDHWARPMASSRDDHQLTVMHDPDFAYVRCTCGWEWGDIAGMTLDDIERVAATAASHDRSQ